MNFADIADVWRVFKNSVHVVEIYNRVVVIGVDVDPLDGKTFGIDFLSELYDCAEIFGSIVYKKFIGVEEDNPIALSGTERDVARRREIVLPRLVKNFRAETFSDCDG